MSYTLGVFGTKKVSRQSGTHAKTSRAFMHFIPIIIEFNIKSSFSYENEFYIVR